MNIKTELRLCKDAFKGVEIGALVQCCHHEMPVEVLTEPAINRINYIMTAKPVKERARRLHEFRPFTANVPAWLDKVYSDLDKARSDLDKARSDRDKARSDWDKARSDWDKARSDWDKACSDWDKACSDWDKARSDWGKVCYEHKDEHKDELIALIKQTVPDSSWDGKTILG